MVCTSATNWVIARSTSATRPTEVPLGYGNPFSLTFCNIRSAYQGEYGLPHQCAHWFAMTVEILSTPATTQLPNSQSVGYSMSANFITAVGAVQRSAGDKRSAGADLIASIALRRTRRTQVRLPSKPPYKSQNPKGGFGALWRVFLRYLSSRKERYRHRRS